MPGLQEGFLWSERLRARLVGRGKGEQRVPTQEVERRKDGGTRQVSYSNEAWETAAAGWREARQYAESEEEAEQAIKKAEDRLVSDHGLSDDDAERLMMLAC